MIKVTSTGAETVVDDGDGDGDDDDDCDNLQDVSVTCKMFVNRNIRHFCNSGNYGQT